MPKVSVIMPAYNAERYIAEAIDSLLTQTWQDWELIVVDDGSTDQTAYILRQYSDTRIKKVHQNNLGEAGARNTGLEMASGELVAFLDADDLYFPSALADFVTYMERHLNIGVTYSDGAMVDANKTRLMRLTEHRPDIYEGDILERVVLSASVITVPSCTIVRRHIIESHDIRFNTQQGFGTDRLFFIDLARVANFGYLDKLTCMYRIHESNMNRTLQIRERKEAATRLHLTIINSDWFNDLSIETRVQFFHGLLANVTLGQPQRQLEITLSDPFLDLPAPQRAYLYRMVATGYLLHRQEPQFAQKCLEQAINVCPHERKSRLLLNLLKSNTRLGFVAVQLWQKIHQTQKWLRSIGKKKPRPVPSLLTQPIE